MPQRLLARTSPLRRKLIRPLEQLGRHHRREVEREEYGRYGNPTVRAAERKGGVQLATKLAILRGSPNPVYLLFSSTRKEDGARWCPDCASADPILDEAFESLPASVTPAYPAIPSVVASMLQVA